MAIVGMPAPGRGKWRRLWQILGEAIALCPWSVDPLLNRQAAPITIMVQDGFEIRHRQGIVGHRQRSAELLQATARLQFQADMDCIIISTNDGL